MPQELEKSRRLSIDQYTVYKDWYIEAHRYPKYILTANLAFLAFEGTNFVVNNEANLPNKNFLIGSMVCLVISGFFSGWAMVICYLIFETGVRDYLSPVMWQFGIKPNKNRIKMRRRGFKAWTLFIASLVSFFVAVALLFAFTVGKLNAKDIDECQTSFKNEKQKACEQYQVHKRDRR